MVSFPIDFRWSMTVRRRAEGETNWFQKSSDHHLGCKKKLVNNGMNYQPQLVSLPDFWTINSMGSIISHYKDPITNQSVWWNVIDGSKFSYTCLWENTRVKVVPVMRGNWRLVKIRICCHFLRDEILIIETYENITFQKTLCHFILYHLLTLIHGFQILLSPVVFVWFVAS